MVRPGKPKLIEECLVEFDCGFTCSGCEKITEGKCLKVTWPRDATGIEPVQYLCTKCFKSLQHRNHDKD